MTKKNKPSQPRIKMFRIDDKVMLLTGSPEMTVRAFVYNDDDRSLTKYRCHWMEDGRVWSEWFEHHTLRSSTTGHDAQGDPAIGPPIPSETAAVRNREHHTT